MHIGRRMSAPGRPPGFGALHPNERGKGGAGKPGRCHSGRRRAVLRAVLRAAPAVLLLLTTPAVPVQAALRGGLRPAALAADPTPLQVVIDHLEPPSAGPRDSVTISGYLTNAGTEPLDGLYLTVGRGSMITSRSQLTGDLATPPKLAVPFAHLTQTTAPTSLGPGGSTRFTTRFSLPMEDMTGPNATVYPLQVRVDSSVGSGRYGLGQTSTFLPYFPGGVAAPLRISWLWPLDAPPALDASGRISQPEVPATFGPSGRLRRLLDLGQPPPLTAPGRRAPPEAYAPVTWALEPSLLATAQTVARNGWLRTPAPASGNNAETGRMADTGARQWLADLVNATNGQDVIPLPYGDPDVVAEVRAGLPDALRRAAAMGRSAVQAAVPKSRLLSRVAWPAHGAVDQPSIDALASAAFTTIVIDGAQLPPSPAATATPTMVTSLPTRSGPIRALAADPEAQALLASAGRDAPSSRMSEQRLLALLAVIVQEAPNGRPPRDLLLELPRGSDPPVDWARSVLRDTQLLPWLDAVPLSATDVDRAGTREPLRPYPAAARAAELPPDIFTGAPRSLDTLQALVGDVRGMLPDSTLTGALDQALERAASVAWRPAPPGLTPSPGLTLSPGIGGSTALREQVANLADGLLRGVKVAGSGQVTLTSRTGTVPVTVENALDERVQVRLTLISTDRSKLEPAPPQQVTVGAHRKQRVLVPATTQRAGTFRVRLELTTPDGRPISTLPLVVHSSAYGLITLVITLSAVGVLVLALLARLVRRLVGRRRGPAVPS